MTKYQYTGQYSYASDFGLLFYNARFYDSLLGRFTSADSIIPDGVQGLDRYAYGLNNPSRYTDPSGHAPCDARHRDEGPSKAAGSITVATPIGLMINTKINAPKGCIVAMNCLHLQ
jgi:RHS repeat-associated protein